MLCFDGSNLCRVRQMTRGKTWPYTPSYLHGTTVHQLLQIELATEGHRGCLRPKKLPKRRSSDMKRLYRACHRARHTFWPSLRLLAFGLLLGRPRIFRGIQDEQQRLLWLALVVGKVQGVMREPHTDLGLSSFQARAERANPGSSVIILSYSV